jgi:hypothetical protein
MSVEISWKRTAATLKRTVRSVVQEFRQNSLYI